MARVEDRWLKKDRKTRSSEYGKGSRWRVVWEEPGGKQCKKSFASFDAAKTFETSIISDLHTGEYHPLTSGIMTVEDWSETWLKLQLHQRDTSIDSISSRIRNNVIPSLGTLQMRDVTKRHVQEAVADWDKTMAANTIKLAFSYMSMMMRQAVEEKQIKENPCDGVKLPKVERSIMTPLTVAQVQKMYETFDVSLKTPVLVAASSGLRPSELFGLTWDRVDLERGVLKVDRQFTGTHPTRHEWRPLKTAASYRSVRVGPVTVQHLTMLAESGTQGMVFSDDGDAFTPARRSTAWRLVRKTLPWMGDGWHQLRHHHASLLISDGMSPVAVAHRLGHKDANETLRTYAHLWPTDDERMALASDGLVVSLEDQTP